MDISSFLNVIGIKTKPKSYWKKYYSKAEWNFEVPELTLYEMLKEKAEIHSKELALNYFGKTMTYKEFLKQIERCANAFLSHGIRKGDVVTICMPNTPEALICFYAINKIGAISNMIHPLSGEKEIKHYLTSTESVMLVMIDLCYEKIKNIIEETNVYKTVVVSAKDSMPFLLKVGYTITKEYKIEKPVGSENYISWKSFMLKADRYTNHQLPKMDKGDPAVILHSGGTTGTPKGIVLSNANFNALSIQGGISFKRVEAGDKILAIMPIFHGFGLGVSMHAPLCLGTTLILVPQFDMRKFHKLLEKYEPNVLFGVPTLYEALVENAKNKKLDLSYIKYVISGGDSLSEILENRINDFLKEHHCQVSISQGYGMTESLAATALAFDEANVKGSIGIPLAGNYYKIVTPGTQEEVEVGEDGEICVCGPTVMLGYLNNEKETNEMLQIHKDGNIWLHTGDIGMMNEEGIIFYRQRLKRMIITSGYNVYPSHVEKVIEEHEAVLKCTVIGVPHPYKMEVAKAFIVLKNDHNQIFVKKSIKEHCKKHLAKYAVPYEFEFRKSLPKTLIGKVDFKKLQQEEREKEERKSQENPKEK